MYFCTLLRSLSLRLALSQTFFVISLMASNCFALSLQSIICVDTSKHKFTIGKEVIQPQVPLGLPCYDFTPVMNHTVVNALPKVKLSTSGATHSHGVTGGVYKARERIHRNILICDY